MSAVHIDQKTDLILNPAHRIIGQPSFIRKRQRTSSASINIPQIFLCKFPVKLCRFTIFIHNGFQRRLTKLFHAEAGLERPSPNQLFSPTDDTPVVNIDIGNCKRILRKFKKIFQFPLIMLARNIIPCNVSRTAPRCVR